MSAGSFHYRRAEELLVAAASTVPGPGRSGLLAEAAIHAQLATAGALAGLTTVSPPHNVGAILGRPDEDEAEWTRVLYSHVKRPDMAGWPDPNTAHAGDSRGD